MITLTLSNPAILDDLARFIDKLSNPTPQITNRIEDAVRVGFAENFATESAGGTPWEQLAPFTNADRVKKGFPAAHPILVRTGDYRDSFTDRNNPDAFMDFAATGDGWAMDIGSSDSRVEELEGGTSRIPARPAAVLSPAAQNNVLDEIERLIISMETV
jgi:phage gpG-like protein